MSDTKNRLHKTFGVIADEHGDSQWYPESTEELEVIIRLGRGRTGTASMRAALDVLGFGPVLHGVVRPKGPHKYVYTEMTLVTWKGTVPPPSTQQQLDRLSPLSQSKLTGEGTSKRCNDKAASKHHVRISIDLGCPGCHLIPNFLQSIPMQSFCLPPGIPRRPGGDLGI